jgi:hypothetical protein
VSTYIWYVHKSNGVWPHVHFNSNHLIMLMWRIPPILCSPNLLWVEELFLKEFILWMNFLEVGTCTWRLWMQREYLLTCYHMSLACAYLSKISDFRLNVDCILIVHNDHVNDLTKSVPIDICYVHKSNYG